MVELVRLVTVHPALVHFTIGAVPILVLAYTLAWWFESAKWSFVGDVVLMFAAAITVVTVAFGAVSNWVIAWPGGLGTWRWLHVAFGVGAAAALAIFAVARLMRRARRPLTGAGMTLASATIALMVVFAGWIGGELLVFRSGVAVAAAGNGVLAPPLKARPDPESLHEAMGDIRAGWASATSELATIIVHEPTEERYAVIARSAERIAEIARWIATDHAAADHPHGDAHAQGHAGGHNQMLTEMAKSLEERATALRQAAQRQDLGAVVESLGEVSAACAACHQSMRWEMPHGGIASQ